MLLSLPRLNPGIPTVLTPTASAGAWFDMALALMDSDLGRASHLPAQPDGHRFDHVQQFVTNALNQLFEDWFEYQAIEVEAQLEVRTWQTGSLVGDPAWHLAFFAADYATPFDIQPALQTIAAVDLRAAMGVLDALELGASLVADRTGTPCWLFCETARLFWYGFDDEVAALEEAQALNPELPLDELRADVIPLKDVMPDCPQWVYHHAEYHKNALSPKRMKALADRQPNCTVEKALRRAASLRELAAACGLQVRVRDDEETYASPVALTWGNGPAYDQVMDVSTTYALEGGASNEYGTVRLPEQPEMLWRVVEQLRQLDEALTSFDELMMALMEVQSA